MPYPEIESCGVRFRAVDPSSYPFATYEFSDEAEVKRRFWSDLRPGEWVVDLGASWGGYALPALAQGARVLAVEPSPRTGEALRESVRANGWQDRALVVRAALWDDSLAIPEEFRNAAMRNFGDDDRAPLTTLDALVESYGLPEVSRIKFDVEGAEFAILRGAARTLARFRPRLLIEDHDKAPDAPDAALVPYAVGLRKKVVALLGASGYEVEEVWVEGGGNPFLWATPK